MEYISPCGRLIIGAVDESICLCDWKIGNRIEKTLRLLERNGAAIHVTTDSSLLDQAATELDEYFAGARKEFNLPLHLTGTPFQRMVWQTLLKIPYGETASYKEVAKEIGKPDSVRAVANAVGANPLSILIPCHRIVGADGTLTGYAGGLITKGYLLDLEMRPRGYYGVTLGY